MPLTNLVRVLEGDGLYPPPDLDPIELSNDKEFSLPLGSSVAVTCSVQGLPTPALRWTKVRGKGDPSCGTCCLPTPPPLLSWFTWPLLPSLPIQDAVRLVDGPTLSLNSVTFNSAGTYICEAYTPTVPLLSRTQALKLLVEGLGVGAGWDGDNGGGRPGPMGRDHSWSSVSCCISLPLSFSYSLSSFPTVPPAHALPPHHPQGHLT